MPARFFRLYQREPVISTNVNIITAGIVSTLMVKGLIWEIEALNPGLSDLFYTVFSLIADIILDAAIFYGMHWIANHWRPLRGKSHKEHKLLSAEKPDFLKDATLKQVERTLFSPLYYLIAAPLMHALQVWGMKPGWAVLVAYPTGLLVTRTLHTLWGLRYGRFKTHRRRAIERRLKARRPARDAAAKRLACQPSIEGEHPATSQSACVEPKTSIDWEDASSAQTRSPGQE